VGKGGGIDLEELLPRGVGVGGCEYPPFMHRQAVCRVCGNSLELSNHSGRLSSIFMRQVFFVGTEAKIDMRPSGVWLKEKTAHWTFKKHLKIGVKRDEALEILSSEGTLLVLCSLIDNMP